MRIYFEQLLKEIAEKLQVPMPYRTNANNDNRGLNEIATALHSHLKSSEELLSAAQIPFLLGMPLFIKNKASHASSFEVGMGDLKGAWGTIETFRNSFFCTGSCNQMISKKRLEHGGEELSCKCGKLRYARKRKK